MPDLFTVKNESLVEITPPVAPITNPLGAPPPANSVSVGNAAAGAASAVTAPAAFLGLPLEGAEGVKNILFLSLVGYLIWKYGRGILNA